MVEGMRSQPGQVENVSGHQVAMRAPAMIWPSPPMLMTLARKAMQMPSPTSRSGVAFTRVCVSPNREPTTPRTSAAYAASGSAFRMTSMTAPRSRATITPTRGSRTFRTILLQSMRGASRELALWTADWWSQEYFLSAYLYHTRASVDRKISPSMSAIPMPPAASRPRRGKSFSGKENKSLSPRPCVTDRKTQLCPFCLSAYRNVAKWVSSTAGIVERDCGGYPLPWSGSS